MHTLFPSLPRRSTSILIGMMIGVIVGFITLLPRVDAVGIAPGVIDLRVNRGEVVEQTITVINTDDQKRSFEFEVVNFTPSDEPGLPIFDGGAGDDLPSWVTLSPQSFTMESGEVRPVKLVVSLPPNARPGDYYGAVLVGNGEQQTVKAQAALLMFLTVEGISVYDVDLVSLNAASRVSSYKKADLTLRVQNAGNVFVKPVGEIVFNSWFGGSDSVPVNPDELRILAKQSIEWAISFDLSPEEQEGLSGLQKELRAFAVGPVTVKARIEVGNDEFDERTILIWVLPWRTGLLVLGFIVAMWALRSFLVRQMRKKKLK